MKISIEIALWKMDSYGTPDCAGRMFLQTSPEEGDPKIGDFMRIILPGGEYLVDGAQLLEAVARANTDFAVRTKTEE